VPTLHKETLIGLLARLVRALPPVLRPTARFVLYRVLGHRDEQWCRVVMNRQTLELIERLGPRALDVLEIAGLRWQSLLPFHSYRSVGLPDYDVCDTPLAGDFDLIVAEQVFEHLLYPFRAARNVHRMLRSGGHFLITTPFLLRVHNYPSDCTRWTETGLRHFLDECGFPLEGIVSGSWGNRDCVVGNFEAWPYYNRFHSLKNEPEFPVVVWALAAKP
jgi:SAM-dependent methyltransferase